MTQKKRRFFSGPSLPAALVAAASEHGLQPEEIDYRVIEKKHGFLKVRRNVVIEVDPDSPKKVVETKPVVRPRQQTQPVEPPETVAAAPQETEGETRSSTAVEELPQLRPRQRPDRGGPSEEEAPRRQQRQERGREPAAKRETTKSTPRQRFSQEPAEEARRERPRPPKPRPAAAVEDEPPQIPAESLAPVEERCQKAVGPLAEGALEAVEWLLDLVDLDVDPVVYKGEERFEIELRGSDRETLLADNGKALAAIEHLVPRVMRGVCGEVYPCRIDSENYQLLREEGLRATARKVASRVRREGRPEILEPMDPSDRRIIHVELSEDPSVSTRSLGDGFFKRVKILPVD